MKKTIIAVAAFVGALFMSSCGDQKGCWEITATYEFMGITQSATSYVYGTRNDVDAAVAEAKEKLKDYEDVLTITKKKVNKAEADCQGVKF